MGNRLGGLLERAAESLDMPVEVIGGLPRAEIRGRHEVLLESHQGVREYGSQCIVIDTPSGAVRVRGDDLTIRSMDQDRIVINGVIVSYEFM